jgi:hypothetical protein
MMFYTNFSIKDDCNLLDFDKSQERVLKRTVYFQGVEVPLETLIGKHLSEIIKQHIDSDVFSVSLGRERKVCIGKKLDDFFLLCSTHIGAPCVSE